MRFLKKGIHPGVVFIIVNLFFFLPGYILNLGENTFLPSTTLPGGESTGALFHLFARDNQDIFRLSVEWLLIASLFWVGQKWKVRKILFTIGLLTFSLLFFYNFYLQFSLKTYGEIPNFSNDRQLIKEVLPLFLDQFSQGNKSWIYVLAALVVGLFVGIHYALLRWFVKSLEKVKTSRWMVIGMAGVFLLVAGFTYKNTKSTYPPIFNSVQWTAAPFAESLHELRPKATEMLAFAAPYQSYFDQQLAKKPDVYLLFVESYGEVLYSHENLKESYLPLLQKMRDSLSHHGFSAQSILSESPIMGGRSWLGFTSAICGITLNNQLMFNELLRMPEYPHLIHFFNQQGYQTLRIKSMSDNEANVKAAYEKPTRFYDFDQWLKYNDIPYQGYKYDWFGGIPDQYVLNYVEEEVSRDSGESRFLFYINMNSHGPWFPQAPVLEDWRKLDTIPRIADELIDFQALLSAPVEERYLNAISYQLDYLTQFIVKHADSNDIFVLIGDHQPAIVYRQGIDGFHTPMHIISKDTSFLHQFAEKGFFAGLEIMNPADTSRQIKHADMYSLLVEGILEVYGNHSDQAILGKKEASISE